MRPLGRAERDERARTTTARRRAESRGGAAPTGRRQPRDGERRGRARDADRAHAREQPRRRRGRCSRATRRKGGTATAKPSKKTVTVKIRWSRTTPPQKYLADAFDDHPVDWEAVVYINDVKKGTGDGELDVEMTEGETYSVTGRPDRHRRRRVLRGGEPEEAHRQGGDRRRQARVQPREHPVHAGELGQGGPRPDEGGRRRDGADVRPGHHRQQARHSRQSKKTNDVLRQQCAERRRPRGDQEIAREDGRLQQAHDQRGHASATTRSAARWTSTSTWIPTSPTTGRRRARSRAPRATSG